MMNQPPEGGRPSVSSPPGHAWKWDTVGGLSRSQDGQSLIRGKRYLAFTTEQLIDQTGRQIAAAHAGRFGVEHGDCVRVAVRAGAAGQKIAGACQQTSADLDR